MLQMAINDLNCTSSEERLVDCPRNARSSTMCHRDDASVVCQPLDGN